MNKIIVSIIFAIALIVVVNKITDTIYYVEKPEKSAFQVTSVSEVTTSKETASVSNTTSDFKVLLASASASDGEKVFKKCVACHSIEKGGKNKIGPALWGVLGRTTGTVEGYKYSKALKTHGKSWSFEEMNGFLLKPKDWIKGTKMSFAGLKKEEERAAIIIYLNSMSSSPLSLE